MDLKLKPINIEFQKLNYTVSLQKKDKSILNGVSGCFKSGELTAIMGPSGAGKSSLLNILTGFVRHGVSGEVNMNNAKLGGKKYRKLCSYILQDDNLYPMFTVYETMKLATNLKIAGVSNDEKEQIINSVLNTLHLIHTKSTRCGSLSGGQRKRLSIALELLDNPPVLFLDEPTTGLDSSSSSYCVELLHDLSREGRTIVCTIHQPAASVYEMFDHVYVLSAGNCIFQGSALNTVPYLSSIGLQCPKYHNPADFLLEVANGEYGDFNPQMAIAALDGRWRQTIAGVGIGQLVASPATTATEVDALLGQGSKMPHPSALIEQFSMEPTSKTFVHRIESNDSHEMHATPSEWSKFWVLVRRCHVHYYRDWTLSYLKLMMAIATAVLVGLMYGDSGINAKKSVSNIGLLLVGLAYLWYTTIMPSVLKFPSEIAILKKETFNNWYKVRTYFLANMLTTSPMNIVFSALYATIVFFLTEQLFEVDRFVKVVVVYVLVTNIADGLGLILGASLDPINGTFVGAIVSAFKLALCGFLALSNQIARPMQLMMYLSSISYSLEALVLALYDYNRPDMQCPTSEVYCHYKTAKMVIQELGMKPKNYEVDVAVMIGQVILFKVLAYLILKRRMKSE